MSILEFFLFYKFGFFQEFHMFGNHTHGNPISLARPEICLSPSLRRSRIERRVSLEILWSSATVDIPKLIL